MDFEKIKEEAFDKASNQVAQIFVKQMKEPKDDLAVKLAEQNPELANLVEGDRNNLIMIREIATALLEEYHKELSKKLKENGITIDS